MSTPEGPAHNAKSNNSPARDSENNAQARTNSPRGRQPGRGRINKTAPSFHPRQGIANGQNGDSNRPRTSSTGSDARLKAEAPSKANEKQAEDNSDEVVCFICADNVKYYAVGECGHRTCSLCNLRLRALFKSKACPYCKTELESVVYTREVETPYEELLKAPLPYADKSLGIKFDCKEAYDDTMHTLQFNCPHTQCEYADAEGWRGLKDHTRKKHVMQFCDLCLKNKMAFAREHRLFTKAQLRIHFARGDGIGFTGHPECQFCHIAFYDNDQLFEHCRKKHEQCFICTRSGVGRHVYFANYNTLEEHFNRDHFPCKKPECLEKKFVVFENDIDLQSHDLEEHSRSIVGQRARRDAKHINVNFQTSTQQGGSSANASGFGQSSSSGVASGGGSRNKNKSRQNADQRGPSAMAVNGPDATGVSIAGRQRPSGFGHVSEVQPQAQTQTQPASNSYSRIISAPVSRPTSPEPEPEASTLWPTLGTDSGPMRNRAPTAFGRLSESAGGRARDPAITAISEETIASHQELLQRVSAYLSHRDQPVSRFRQLTTQYKNNQVSAEDYVQNCWLLFLTVPGRNAKEMIQKTVKAVSSLLPEANQKERLLKALGEHRIKQQQFPALTPLTGSGMKSGGLSANGSTARVLVIKQAGGSSSGGGGGASRAGWTKPTQASTTSPTASSSRSRAEVSIYESKRASSTAPLSSTTFPSLGSSSSTPSINSMVSRMNISPSPASPSHNSYSGKFIQTVNTSGGNRSQKAAKPSRAESSLFPDLPPPSVARVKIAPLNPNASSAWSASDEQSSASSSQQGSGDRRQPRNKSKGKQVLFYVG